MPNHVGRARALVVAVVAVVMAAGMPAGYTPSARADTAPPSSGTPTTVSSDALPTTQMDGVAWTQVIAGGKVYVGGKFGLARPAGAAEGEQTVERVNFLAYDLATGVLDEAFHPEFDAEVRALAVSPDGKTLFVGGTFTHVDDIARNRLAAFDLGTGALLPSFDAGTNGRVVGLAATAERLYVVGNFSSVGNDALSLTRDKAAALDPRTGAVLPFAVRVADAGSIRQVVVSPDGTKAVLGGNFTSLNNSDPGNSADSGYGLALVDAETGKSLPMPVNRTVRDAGVDASILSLVGTATGFYGSGYVFDRTMGNLEGAFRADWDGNLVWLEDCHGDTYSIAATEKILYTASHAHECSTIGGPPRVAPLRNERMLAFTTDATQVAGPTPHTYSDFVGKPAPSLVHWFPYFEAGEVTDKGQAVWSLAANESYVVAGGEFPSVNGTDQQGLVRFATAAIAPNTDGPQLVEKGDALSAQGLAGGRVRLSWTGYWDRDNERLGYQLFRGDTLISEQSASSTFWRGARLSYVDSGLTDGGSYFYRLRVFDAYGNDHWTDLEATATGTLSPTAYASLVLGDGPQSYWPLDSADAGLGTDLLGRDALNAGQQAPVATSGAVQGESRTGVRPPGGPGSGLTGSLKAPGPTDFTTELWFRTASTTGGQLIGFSDLAGVVSDRHVYLSSTGQVNFTLSPRGKSKAITSTKAYNDDRWHHMAASLSSTGGMTLYVDGAKVAANAVVRAPFYMTGGWVKIGGANLAGLPNRPTTDTLTAQVDEAALYPVALTASQIRDHYRRGTAQSVAARPFVADSFSTAVKRGLGWAPVGGPWRVSDPSGTSVAGGKAVLKLDKPGTTRSAYQGASSGSEVTTSFALDKAASGSGVYVKVSGRRVDAQHDYQLVTEVNAKGRARVWIDAVNGATTTRLGKVVTLKGTAKTKKPVSVRLQTFGQPITTVRAKVWLSGTKEPTSWTVTTTDATAPLQGFGQVGVLAYSSKSATKGTVNVSFENLAATRR